MSELKIRIRLFLIEQSKSDVLVQILKFLGKWPLPKAHSYFSTHCFDGKLQSTLFSEPTQEH